MIKLGVLFSKKSKQANMTSLSLKNILTTMSKKNTQNTDLLMKQVINTIETDLEAHIATILKKIPDEYSQTNPFVEDYKPKHANPFDNPN